MEEDKAILEERVLTQVLLLDAKVCGIVTGLFCGVGLFLATNWLILKGGPQLGAHLWLLSHYFPGYGVTFVGSLLGFAYAFVSGFMAGYSVARIYGVIASRRERRAQGHA